MVKVTTPEDPRVSEVAPNGPKDQLYEIIRAQSQISYTRQSSAAFFNQGAARHC